MTKAEQILKAATFVPAPPAKYSYTAAQIQAIRDNAFKAGHDAAISNMERLIDLNTAKKVDELCLKYDAAVLYVLHTNPKTRFGVQRLHDFYMEFVKEHQALREHYEMQDSVYLASKAIEAMGIDLKEWYKEAEEML